MESVVGLDILSQAAGYAEAPPLDAPADLSRGRCRLGFGLFILVNVVLFIRPAEIVPGWEDLPIYLWLILACLLVSLPVVMPQLAWSSLRRNPITVCVIGLLAAIILSHLSHRDFYDARQGATEFIKVVIYYLLLVGLVNSPAHLRVFLLIIAGLVLCTAILCLLNHHGVIDIPALADLNEGLSDDPDADNSDVVVRLRAMGIFNDPNDFCLILNAAIFICLHWLFSKKSWFLRLAWVMPVVPLVYAVMLTQSRGGFLSLVAGLIVLAFVRLSWKRAAMLVILCLPGLLFVGARQTNIDLNDNEDTAQGRIQLWRDSLVEFHGRPLFGIGYGQLSEEIGLVAHNSYVHSYAELGFFGGTMFFGACYLAVQGIRRLNRKGAPALPAELKALRLCLLPVLAAYMVGVYSLSRSYANTTYMVFGVAASFLGFVSSHRLETDLVDLRLARRISMLSVGCVFYFEAFVRIFAH